MASRRDDRGGSPAPVRQGGSALAGPAAARAGVPRPHGPALRSRDVPGLLRPARHPRPRPPPGHRLQLSRPDDRPYARGTRGGHAREPPGHGRRRRRHELHARGRSGRRQARHPGGPRGGRPAQLRRPDARRDQPAPDGSRLEPPLLSDSDRGPEPAGRRDTARRPPRGGRHDGRRRSEPRPRPPPSSVDAACGAR